MVVTERAIASTLGCPVYWNLQRQTFWSCSTGIDKMKHFCTLRSMQKTLLILFHGHWWDDEIILIIKRSIYIAIDGYQSR